MFFKLDISCGVVAGYDGFLDVPWFGAVANSDDVDALNDVGFAVKSINNGSAGEFNGDTA